MPGIGRVNLKARVSGRATFAGREFGFLGWGVHRWLHTPRRSGTARSSKGILVFA